jgi:hypothetical protein
MLASFIVSYKLRILKRLRLTECLPLPARVAQRVAGRGSRAKLRRQCQNTDIIHQDPQNLEASVELLFLFLR